MRRAHRQGDRRLPRPTGSSTLVIGGGVAANSRLRVLAEQRAAKHGILVRVPRPQLCTDNGAMVAALGRAPGRGRCGPESSRSACRFRNGIDHGQRGG